MLIHDGFHIKRSGIRLDIYHLHLALHRNPSVEMLKVFVTMVTGDQGGSVARYLIKDGGFEVYGLTRNPDSDAAKGVSLFICSSTFSPFPFAERQSSRR